GTASVICCPSMRATWQKPAMAGGRVALTASCTDSNNCAVPRTRAPCASLPSHPTGVWAGDACRREEDMYEHLVRDTMTKTLLRLLSLGIVVTASATAGAWA